MNAQSAINEIAIRSAANNPMSVNELRLLANNVDVTIGNSTLLLYSGGVGEIIDPLTGYREFKASDFAESLSNATSVKTIADTQIAIFLKNVDFRQALEDAAAREGLNFDTLYLGIDENGTRINNTSFWDEASARLVNQHTGDFRLIMPHAPDGSVAVETEIPTLLHKTIQPGQKVNGIDLQDWQNRYNAEKLLSGENAAKAELVSLIRATSNADLADMSVGRDATGKLYLDTNSYLGRALGLPAKEIPAGIEVTRLASLSDMHPTDADMARYVKYGDLLNKAGLIGDVLGTALAIAQAQHAYNNGNTNEAGAILTAHAGGLVGGFAAGTASAALVAGLLLAPGVNVGVGAGMAITGAAGLAGGYFGGLAGEKLFENLYKNVTSIDMALFFQNLVGDFSWAMSRLGSILMRELGELTAVSNAVNNLYLQFKNWIPPRTDPLVLDLDKDGIETVGISGSIVFDHDGDGIKTGTGWVSSDDGFLVLDRNGNGTIDTGAELFGVDTLKSDGLLAKDGFDALSDLDSNSDGLFDQNDDEFMQVQVWRDLNQNGVSTTNELFSLTKLGVVSIELTAHRGNVNLGDGNVQTASAAHLTVDGEGLTANLDLANNPFYRKFVDTLPLTDEVLSLPNAKGSGFVRDLQEAASISPALSSVLENYANQTSYLAQKALLDDLLTAWANTSTMKTSIKQAADNGYFLFYLTPNQSWSDHDTHLSYWNTADGALLDALEPEIREEYQKLLQQQQETDAIISVLERFNASTFVAVGADQVTLGNGSRNSVSAVVGSDGTSIERVFVSLSTQQIELMQQSYEALKESVYESLVLQTRLSHYLDVIALNETTAAEVVVDFSALNALLDHQKNVDPSSALADLIELNKYAGHVLYANGWSGLDMLRSWIAEGVAGEQTAAILHELGVSSVKGDNSAGSKDDIIFSAPANTVLNGYSGDDILSGRAGNDTLSGGGGHDILDGGRGRDLLTGGEGNDVLHGGQGDNDYLQGDSGDDTYLFAAGDGNTTINNIDLSVSHDVLRLKEGINPAEVSVKRDSHHLYLTVRNTGEVITVINHFYEEGNSTYALDRIEFSDGTTWDNEAIKQIVMQTTLGNDNIIGFASDDTVDGLSGDDNLAGVGGNDYLNGSEGNDTLDGGEGDDTLLGGSGKDYLYGVNGNDVLDGGEGADMLFGGAGDDVLRGGAGTNDYLTGDAGSDTYLFAAGDGSTTINNYDTATDSYDVLRFLEGVHSDDVAVTRDSYSLYLTLQSTGEKISITHYFYLDATSDYVLDAIEFSDGAVWDIAMVKQKVLQGTLGTDNLIGFVTNDTIDGLAGNDTLNGGEGDDTLLGGSGKDYLYGVNGNDVLDGGEGADMLFGGAGDDTLRGGAGVNDYLTGDAGSDTYLFAAGDGSTTINNYDTATDSYDVLRFLEGVHPDDVAVTRDSYNLYLTLQSTAEKITVTHYFYQDATSAYALDAIEFSDGTIWDVATVKQLSKRGTNGDDNITGSASDDFIDGLAGNDTLNGGEGNDTLWGGLGNDYLYGVNGNDVLEGGEGTDMLFGGAGEDTLRGGTGTNDYLSGDAGSDTYLFATGDGSTTINNYDTATDSYDVLRFLEDVHPDDVTVTRDSHNLYLTLQSTAEKITVAHYFYQDATSAYALDAIEFSDGTTWDIATVKQKVLQGTLGQDNLIGFVTNDTIDGLAGNDTLNGGEGDDTLLGGAGNDYLYGVNGNDVLEGGDGTDMLFGGAGDDVLRGGAGTNDYLTGDAGSDTYLFAAGDGHTAINNYDSATDSYDVLRFLEGVHPDDVTVTRDSYNLYLTLQSTAEKITVAHYFYQDAASAYVLDAIEFSDGTTWDIETVKQKVLQGTLGQDNLIGFSTNDTIDGLAGNDTLNGGEGDDTLLGGAGNDYLYGVNGNDVLEGGEGADILYGGAGDDMLRGGAGVNDYLIGETGSDTYLFAAGDGHTAINNYDSATDSYDVLRFLEGVHPDDVTVTRDSYNLYLTLQSTAEKITVAHYFYQDATSAYVLDAIEFSDGTVWDIETVKQKVLQGTLGQDNLIGFSTNDTIDGLAGNDTLNGGEGDDTLLGGAGNDYLYGVNGNDVLEGGEGADILYGGAGDDMLRGGVGANDYLIGDVGNDTYLFQMADGKDTINNYDTDAASIDILKITDASFENLWFSRNASNLQINIVGTDDQLTIANWYSSDIYQLNEIHAGSAILSNEHVDRLVSAMSAYAVPSGEGSFISPEIMEGLQPLFTEIWL
ncbi:Ca2+-binding RTX toxin-like protein [Nitrosomonas nitrosa]|uniref:calcium-binding protein n=1 Tax=Nitrosomonas nitrosa TaxID=52442 RepID=UPI000D301C60|nr:calcium-binding protein [Nitrosomonas nitrosa]PTQ88478.1 Ca2+-binding RTX toxin-like protein [Nitrosomonas nitrosa]